MLRCGYIDLKSAERMREQSSLYHMLLPHYSWQALIVLLVFRAIEFACLA